MNHSSRRRVDLDAFLERLRQAIAELDAADPARRQQDAYRPAPVPHRDPEDEMIAAELHRARQAAPPAPGDTPGTGGARSITRRSLWRALTGRGAPWHR